MSKKNTFLSIVLYILILLVTFIVLLYKKDDYSYTAGILLLLLFLPLEVFGYYQYKKIFEKKGVILNQKKEYKKGEIIDSAVDILSSTEPVITTNIFLSKNGKKSKKFGGILNFFSDIIVNIIYLIYTLIGLFLSGFIVWSILKMLKFI